MTISLAIFSSDFAMVGRKRDGCRVYCKAPDHDTAHGTWSSHRHLPHPEHSPSEIGTPQPRSPQVSQLDSNGDSNRGDIGRYSTVSELRDNHSKPVILQTK